MKKLTNLNEYFEKRVSEEVDKKLEMRNEEIKIIKVKTKDNTRQLYKDYEKLQTKYSNKSKILKQMILRVLIAEDSEIRLHKIVEKKKIQVKDLEIQNQEKDNQIRELQREIEMLKTIGNNDGTTSSIPTSMTPIGKKKVISNFVINTGGKMGRKDGYKKDKL